MEPVEFLFWVLMVLWALSGVVSHEGKITWRVVVPIFPFLLILILGLCHFGVPGLQ